MAKISIDVIALVIDNVQDDRGTLFSLLTVNKQVFRYTCAVLYRDPFRFFRNECPYDEKSLKTRMSLVWLLLNLSPAVDDDTNLVRRALNGALKRGSETEAWSATKLDYFSFIQCVRLGISLQELQPRCALAIRQWVSYSPAALRGVACRSTFKSIVTWSICGHRLNHLCELEIEAQAIERFVKVAPQLCRLRIIVVGSFNTDLPRGVDLMTTTYPSAVRLVQALQHHHGMDRLLDFRFSYSFDMIENKTFFQWNVAIRKMLPPLLPHDLKLALPLRPMDSCLSRLTELKTVNNDASWWNEISKEYTDMSVGQVLQRCRKLVQLELDFLGGGIDDAGALAWAVEERRDRAAGRLLVPAVPLESINLKLAGLGTVDTLRVLMDGICAFGPSLDTLQVSMEPHEKMEDVGLRRLPLPQDESMMMPRLRTFRFTSSVIELLDVRLLRSFPSIMTLDVSTLMYQDKHASHEGWPVLHLPHLISLKLCGLAVLLFNPASLHGMPQLQSMEFFSLGVEQGASDSRPTLQDNWTWDWDLPKLKFMHARIDLSQATFSFRFLRGCPNLSRLHLEFCDGPAYPLDVSSALTNSTQDIYPHLQDLRLKGAYTLQLEDLRILLRQALPGLTRLFMRTVGTCTREQAEEVTRDHPSMRYVTFQHRSRSLNEVEGWGLSGDRR